MRIYETGLIQCHKLSNTVRKAKLSHTSYVVFGAEMMSSYSKHESLANYFDGYSLFSVHKIRNDTSELHVNKCSHTKAELKKKLETIWLIPNWTCDLWLTLLNIDNHNIQTQLYFLIALESYRKFHFTPSSTHSTALCMELKALYIPDGIFLLT